MVYKLLSCDSSTPWDERRGEEEGYTLLCSEKILFQRIQNDVLHFNFLPACKLAPQVIFLLSLFGWLILLIFWKWVSYYPDASKVRMC